jgi:hypothetical protein
VQAIKHPYRQSIGVIMARRTTNLGSCDRFLKSTPSRHSVPG